MGRCTLPSVTLPSTKALCRVPLNTPSKDNPGNSVFSTVSNIDKPRAHRRLPMTPTSQSQNNGVSRDDAILAPTHHARSDLQCMPTQQEDQCSIESITGDLSPSDKSTLPPSYEESTKEKRYDESDSLTREAQSPCTAIAYNNVASEPPSNPDAQKHMQMSAIDYRRKGLVVYRKFSDMSCSLDTEKCKTKSSATEKGTTLRIYISADVCELRILVHGDCEMPQVTVVVEKSDSPVGKEREEIRNSAGRHESMFDSIWCYLSLRKCRHAKTLISPLL